MAPESWCSADLPAFFEDVDIFGGKRGHTEGAGGFVVLLDEFGEMERRPSRGGARADDEDVGLKLFALCGHWSSSLAEHANVCRVARDGWQQECYREFTFAGQQDFGIGRTSWQQEARCSAMRFACGEEHLEDKRDCLP